MVGFAKHMQYYKALLLSLKRRGLDVTNYEVSFLNYGSNGCIRKLGDLSFQYESQLTENERKLIASSKRAYNSKIVGILAFFITLLLILVVEIIG